MLPFALKFKLEQGVNVKNLFKKAKNKKGAQNNILKQICSFSQKF